MKCADAKELLIEYLLRRQRWAFADVTDAEDGADAAEAELRKHLAECASCAGEAADASRIFELVDGKTAPARLIRVAHYIIQEGLNQGATSIHVDLTEFDAQVRYRKDGRLYESKHRLDAETGELVIARMKHMAGVVPIATDSKDGVIPICYNGADFRVRATFFSTAWGQCAILHLTAPVRNLALEDAGFSDDELQAVKKLLDGKEGLIVLVGVPSPSLRTTRLALDSYISRGGTRAVYGIERFTPGPIAGVRSMRATDDLVDVIDRALSGDPDAISVANVYDIHSVQRAIDFADQGHFVIVEIYADSTQEALDRVLSDIAGPSAARSLVAVVHQKDVERGVQIFEIDTATGRREEFMRASHIENDEQMSLRRREAHFTFDQSASERISSGLLTQEEVDRALMRTPVPLSQQSLNYIRNAREMAAAKGSPFYTTRNVAAAMLDDPTSMVSRAVSAAGVDLREFVESEPHSDKPTPVQSVYPHPWIANMLYYASMIAEQEHADTITPEHLVRGFLSDNDNDNARMLARKGITREVMEDAFRAVDQAQP